MNNGKKRFSNAGLITIVSEQQLSLHSACCLQPELQEVIQFSFLKKGDHGAQYWNCRKWMSVIFNGCRQEPLSDFTSWWHRIHITRTVQTLTKAGQTVKREACSPFEGKWRRIWPEGEGRLGNEWAGWRGRELWSGYYYEKNKR